MIYVAFLRGINVGGNNKVEMKKLKSTFELLGFINVVTYINSGNVIFEDSSKRQDAIVSKIEKAIKNDFQLNIKALVRDLKNIETIVQILPLSWVKNKLMRTDIMFLWEEFDSPGVLEQLRITLVDNVNYVSGAVLWNIAEKDYSKSGMTKLIGTEIYKHMTIRNVNTVRKVYQIMSDLDKRKRIANIR